MRVRSEDGLTIAAHAEIIGKYGAALVGKLGKPVGPDFRALLNRQIHGQVQTNLFLAIRDGWNTPYVAYRCPLMQVHDHLEPTKRNLVPAYYINSASKIGTWFEVSGIERLTRDQMNKIFVITSGKEIASAIGGLASLFRVAMRASQPTAPLP